MFSAESAAGMFPECRIVRFWLAHIRVHTVLRAKGSPRHEALLLHAARHTMATIALGHGAELRTVSEILGHTDISTTLRYAMATDPLKVSAIGAIPGL